MAADRVSRWRAEIDRMTDEALSCADPNVKVSKRSRIVELWAAIVSVTTDKERLALAKEQLALAEKQQYNVYLALQAMGGGTEAQRAATQNFIDEYKRGRDAQIRA